MVNTCLVTVRCQSNSVSYSILYMTHKIIYKYFRKFINLTNLDLKNKNEQKCNLTNVYKTLHDM